MMSSSSTALGIIMLDTRFERPPGDVGNAASWDFPVKFRQVAGASPERVIRRGGEGLLDDFIAAGDELIAEGCSAILTSCGFMARHQSRLAEALSVPVAASSLIQLPMIQMALGSRRRVGVITYDAASLTTDMLVACGAEPGVPVAGVPADGAFRALIERGEPYDRERLEAEILTVARDLVSRNPALGALVLECTNMPPFAAAVAKACAMPVFDILTLGRWLFESTLPAAFSTSEQRGV